MRSGSTRAPAISRARRTPHTSCRATQSPWSRCDGASTDSTASALASASPTRGMDAGAVSPAAHWPADGPHAHGSLVHAPPADSQAIAVLKGDSPVNGIVKFEQACAWARRPSES